MKKNQDMRGPKFIQWLLRPWDASSEKNLRGPNFTVGALHPETPLAEKLLVPKSALDTLCVFCVKLQVPSSNSSRDIMGFQIYTRGASLH